MSEIDEETVRKVARLARIAVTEDEVGPLAKELTGILKWVEQLSEVDTSGVEPMISADQDSRLGMREDKVTTGGIQHKALANAPETREGFFAVPKVVE